MTARQVTPEERAIRTWLRAALSERAAVDGERLLDAALDSERDRLIALAGSEEALPRTRFADLREEFREAQRAIVRRMKETP